MNAGHAYIHALRNATMERRGSLDIWTFNNTYLAEQIRHSKVATNHHSDIGSPVLVYDEWSRGLHSEVLTQHGEDEALAPLICRDSDGRAFFVPTMGELMAALDATASDDPYAIAEVLNLTVVDIEAARMVGWCDEHRYNPGWYGPEPPFAEADYVALRAAVHGTDEDYALALLRADLPVVAIIELCAIPPMPVEYAIAMAGGTA